MKPYDRVRPWWLGIAIALSFLAVRGVDAVIVQANATNPSETFFTVSATDLVNDGQASLVSETSSGYTFDLVPGAPTVLNNGLLGGASDGSQAAGKEAGGGFTVTYTLGFGNGVGYDITRIETFAAWPSSRGGQNFSLHYNTVSDPTFVLAGTFVNAVGADSSSRIILTNDTGGVLSGSFGAMTQVKEIRFTLMNNAGLGQIYRELDVFGSATLIPEPSTALLLLGGGWLIYRRHRKN